MFGSLFSSWIQKKEKEAQQLCEEIASLTPIPALQSLQSWLEVVLPQAKNPEDFCRIIISVDQAARKIIYEMDSDIYHSQTNFVKFNLLIQTVEPFVNHMANGLQRVLLPEIRNLGKRDPDLTLKAVTTALYWRGNAYLIDYYQPPAPQGFEWTKVYPLYAVVHQNLDKSIFKTHSDAFKLQKQMAFLLMLTRSIASDMNGRQVLLVRKIVDALHQFVQTSQKFSKETPYGVNAEQVSNPTLIQSDDPITENINASVIYFGLENALQELLSLEQILLQQEKVPQKIAVDGKQAVAETLAVIRHLKDRWRGKQIMRNARRESGNGIIRVAYDFSAARRLMAQSTLGRKEIMEPTLLEVELKDSSANGIGVLIHGDIKWAKMGGIVGFEIEKDHWEIGAIRRIVAQQHQITLLGIQRFASNPESVRLIEVSQSSAWESVTDLATYRNHLGIYIPPSPLSQEQHGILMPDPRLLMGKTYQVILNKQLYLLRPLNILEPGADFTYYACQAETRTDLNSDAADAGSMEIG